MSEFAVTVERIGEVRPHPNADRLELASIEGMAYQFVVAKGHYQPGDRCVYFPVDSLIPAPIIETLGLTGKLTGKEMNRVKTVRLRGEISQGVVGDCYALEVGDAGIGTDITERLGVTKWEPPVIASKDGNLTGLPRLVSVYDLASAARNLRIVELLRDVPVMVTEKLEGRHFSISIYADGEIKVCQRHHAIEPVAGGEHTWWKVARTSGLLKKMPHLWVDFSPKEVLTLRGELLGLGIQGNYYQLADHEVRLFEVEVDGVPTEPASLFWAATNHSLATVPVLAIGLTLQDLLSEQSAPKYSDGVSLISPADHPVRREGVVIRPIQEMQDERFGRVILKQRSPEYLAESDL